ncbi:hypothetical protein [Peptoniphilus grossensis]|uniref:Uncharacterized protein n=1 Tax=Peptoniphilus grossensis TaxID=1465756 RepID=A0ABU7XBF6_9FIRM
MVEKNLDEKDSKNNMDCEQTQTIEENNLNDDIEFIYTALDRKRRSYKLSYDDKKLEELSDTGIKKYVQDHYLEKGISNQEDLDNNKLLIDIATFKTFRDNLKADMDHYQTLSNFIISLVLAVSSIIITVALAPEHPNLPCVLKIFYITVPIVFSLLLGKLILFDYNSKGNSKFNKLKIVNESIHILEYKKEKLSQKSEDKNK